MNKLQQAIQALHTLDQEADRRSRTDPIHPTARLLVTLLFIAVVVSFHKYDLFGLFGMLLYPLFLTIYEEIPLAKGFQWLRYLLLPLLLIGIANPFLDRSALLQAGNIIITGGMISLATLFLKGALTVCATYCLIVTVGINGICCALRTLRVPQQFVTILLLTYRYLTVFLQEIHRMTQAYQLRAPGEKGIKITAWGSFAGLLLLRSIDRATDVYHSMLLRGYDGYFTYERTARGGSASRKKSIAYGVVWSAALLCLRCFPIYHVAGSLFP